MSIDFALKEVKGLLECFNVYSEFLESALFSKKKDLLNKKLHKMVALLRGNEKVIGNLKTEFQGIIRFFKKLIAHQDGEYFLSRYTIDASFIINSLSSINPTQKLMNLHAYTDFLYKSFELAREKKGLPLRFEILKNINGSFQELYLKKKEDSIEKCSTIEKISKDLSGLLLNSYDMFIKLQNCYAGAKSGELTHEKFCEVNHMVYNYPKNQEEFTAYVESLYFTQFLCSSFFKDIQKRLDLIMKEVFPEYVTNDQLFSEICFLLQNLKTPHNSEPILFNPLTFWDQLFGQIQQFYREQAEEILPSQIFNEIQDFYEKNIKSRGNDYLSPWLNIFIIAHPYVVALPQKLHQLEEKLSPIYQKLKVYLDSLSAKEAIEALKHFKTPNFDMLEYPLNFYVLLLQILNQIEEQKKYLSFGKLPSTFVEFVSFANLEEYFQKKLKETSINSLSNREERKNSNEYILAKNSPTFSIPSPTIEVIEEKSPSSSSDDSPLLMEGPSTIKLQEQMRVSPVKKTKKKKEEKPFSDLRFSKGEKTRTIIQALLEYGFHLEDAREGKGSHIKLHSPGQTGFIIVPHTHDETLAPGTLNNISKEAIDYLMNEKKI